ncbi:MAG: Uma2 family endonuclease [Sandaracinaceae bacterium]|nr:Uma2 family endonuclease [Sandaracinaceae bacterium]
MGEAAPKEPRPMRPPRVLNLVRDPAPEDVGARIDWSAWVLLEEDDVGQRPEHDDVASAFASALRQHLDPSEPARARVGMDAFFAWVRDEPNVRVSPDVYVLDEPPAPPWPKMWETWRREHRPPRFALEIVSDHWKKDYEEGPAKYALLGAEELVIFDPLAARGVAASPRVPVTVYRRDADGSFVRTYSGAGPARLESIGAWAVARPDGGVGWLRLATDAAGADLVPTAEERAEREAERAEREAERAEREAERAEREAERAEQLAARLRARGVDPDA